MMLNAVAIMGVLALWLVCVGAIIATVFFWPVETLAIIALAAIADYVAHVLKQY